MRTYNKKSYLLPGSINTMAGYHAKIFENGEYVFRIHDCITGIRLRGELKTKEDYIECIEKHRVLANALNEFANDVEERMIEFDKREIIFEL